MPEHSLQVALVKWADLMASRVPELGMLYAVPNQGTTSKRHTARLVAEGLRSGIPDLCLPVARNGFHGLYMETKVDTWRPTKDGGRRRYKTYPNKKQRAWMERLEAEGYCVHVWRTLEEGQRILEEYLGVRLTA